MAVLSQVCIEILECVLTHRATFKSIGHSAEDVLDVRFSRSENTGCNNVNFKVQGTWTSLLSCKGVLDGCPSLASVLDEGVPMTTGETEASGDAACMRYIAVNRSKEDRYTITMQSGRLDVCHEEAGLAVENTQTDVTITLKCPSTMEELAKCCLDVRNFLFKFKLVHPLIAVGLSSKCDKLDFKNFEERKIEFASICHGIDIITDPRYFLIYLLLVFQYFIFPGSWLVCGIGPMRWPRRGPGCPLSSPQAGIRGEFCLPLALPRLQ
ncbi:uncharacterized protein LOC129265668 [Lytechinus pictus]|uniref:uncharacterized protein LOC129265668 n=1 Tax=Lytechinus pictus TaxID=7653 RepID=UPI0030B9F2E5